MSGAHPGVVQGTFGWNKAWLSFVADSGYAWIGPIIPFVEVVVGVLLILGLFNGIAALVGLLLNVSFLFAGNAGVNPLFALTVGSLIAAWRGGGILRPRLLVAAIGGSAIQREDGGGTRLCHP